MATKILTGAAALLAAFAFAGQAHAAGGTYVFEGGTQKQQREVNRALQASSFNWSLVSGTVTIHIGPVGTSYATAGNVFLDGDLLNAGRFAWGIVQHEYAHQVDFLLLDAAKREALKTALGTSAWCYEDAAVRDHGAQGCERFASTLAWSYWQTADNSMKPAGRNDESGAIAPAKFRALLGALLAAAPDPAAAS